MAKQDVTPARIVIVGNGCPLPESARRLSLPGEVTAVEREENLGCPGGRNTAIARRRLPFVLVPVHLGVGTLLTVALNRSASGQRPASCGLRAWFGGFVGGLREPAGERRAMSWRTVWRLTRLGRPPVV